MLEEDWTEEHTKETLQNMLHAFDKTVNDDFLKKKEVEKLMKVTNKKTVDLCNRRMENTSAIGKLMGDKENHQQDLRKRLHLMDEIAKKYNIKLAVSSQITQDEDDETEQNCVSIGSDYFSHDGTNAELTQDTYITITPEDMKAFLKATINPFR